MFTFIYFEPVGVDPTQVKQTWMLDQSLVRKSKKGDIYTIDYMKGVKVAIPGFLLSGKCTSHVPCICPNSRVWFNWLNRFAKPNELLQLQGLWLRPCLQQIPNRVKSQACGNAFSSTIVPNCKQCGY